MHNFYITLPSNACTHVYPNNHSSHFKTILPQELHLDTTQWEVGLSEFTYATNSWDNIRDGENEIIIINGKIDVANHYASHKESDAIVWCGEASKAVIPDLNDLTMTVSQQPGTLMSSALFGEDSSTKCYTMEELVDEFNRMMIEALPAHIGSVIFNINGTIDVTVKDKSKTNFTLAWSDDFNKLIKFNVEEEINTAQLPKVPITFTIIDPKLHFASEIKKVATLEPKNYDNVMSLLYDINMAIYQQNESTINQLTFSLVKDINRVKFNNNLKNIEIQLSPTLCRMLGFKESDKFYTDKMTAKNQPNLNFTLSTLWVYTNITEAVIVGDTMANLLRIIPVELGGVRGNQTCTIVKVFERPHYQSLGSCNISMIEVIITTSFGLVPLQFNDNTVLKLHFKKRRVI